MNIVYLIYDRSCVVHVVPFPRNVVFYFLVQDHYKIYKPSFATYWNSVRSAVLFLGRTQSGESL